MDIKENQTNVEGLKNMVEDAIKYLRGIETDLDKLIKIEEVLEIKKEYISD